MLCDRKIPSRGDGLSVARRPAFPRHAPRRRGYSACRGVYAKEIISQGSSVLLCYDAHIEKTG